MEIVRFSRQFDRRAFNCGVPSLNVWLQRYAGQSEKSGNTRTFLAIEEGSVIGYYASRSFELTLDGEVARLGVKNNRYPMPAILLAKLAVEKESQHEGVGARLMVHALTSYLDVAARIGVEAIVVHAIDLATVTYYARWGFRQIEDDPLHLIMRVVDLRETVGR